MSDVTLSDGKEITFNLRNFTAKEYLAMFDGRESDTRSDKTLAKACGVAHSELLAMSFEDYKRILQAFFKKANAPLDDSKATPDNPN